MKEILLNKTKDINSVNVENSINFELSTKRNSLIVEDFNGVINNYEQYLEERNNCDNYKLSFAIQPYMTNVLFNAFTEIISDDGIVGDDDYGKIGSGYETPVNTKTQGKESKGIPYRYQLLRDTECTHEKLGNLKYRCGIDIFNNHYLRTTDFFCIQSAVTPESKNVFNTIEDFIRYSDGSEAKHVREIPQNDPTDYVERTTHIFNRDNIEEFFDAYANRIKDENGWVGFYNHAYANVKNHKLKNGEEISINKCINNRNACDFIDMFPDRTLFSFLPNLNEENNMKEEYNWDWCLTYPYENSKEGEFDFFNNKGIKIIWHSRSEYVDTDGNFRYKKNEISRHTRYIYFRTKCKHNLSPNDSIRISYPDNSGNYNDFMAKVLGVGNDKGEHKEYYFFISYEDLAMEFVETKGRDGVIYITLPNNMFVSRIVNGEACKYYVRNFKKIENIPSSVLSKLAFSKTIYNDNIIQILFNNNVNVSELKDNLGRELSEIYLTIIKRNDGHKVFYEEGNNTNIEGSSCFGKVTSGFNFEMYEGEESIVDINSSDPMSGDMEFKNFNIRTTYNLVGFGTETEEVRERMGLPKVGKILDDENGVLITDDIFYGDFVEYSTATLEETTIEHIYHRFNTAQREYKLTGKGFPCDFSKLSYDEIEYGDFDFKLDGDISAITEEHIPNPEEFIAIKEGMRENAGGNYPYYDNIFPEGYFYKPHYKIKLKEYAPTFTVDYDVKLDSKTCTKRDVVNGVEYYTIENSQLFSLTLDDKIVIVFENDEDGVPYRREFWVAEGTTTKEIVFVNNEGKMTSDKILNIFIKNPVIPSYAYYIADGSGKYVWRELVKDTELDETSDIYNRVFGNGALYINTNINFYVRRQDPHGLYGLQYHYDNVNYRIKNLIIDGLNQVLTDVNYKTEEDYTSCEI